MSGPPNLYMFLLAFLSFTLHKLQLSSVEETVQQKHYLAMVWRVVQYRPLV